MYRVERKKAAKLRESSAWLRLAGAYQNKAFFLHKPVHTMSALGGGPRKADKGREVAFSLEYST